MQLAPGVRLGPYEVVAPIGAGGMGEVYRARDTRLDRTVAIKILPESLASDPHFHERFDREARAISSLNHPHICTLHDVGHQDGVDFLVLEYLEGETLAERLGRSAPGSGRADRGPLRVSDALAVAIQIADALDRAHRSGIVHRDLKPANIFLVRTSGASGPPTAKLLDFGLAKSATPVVATSGLSMMPTTPPGVTAQGTILGTFQYMAPEQIEGLEADARTDIFAFGAVLFEMLTGRTAFEGKTRASLLGAILKDDPPRVSRVQSLAPKALDRIVSTCLAKDPGDRWQSARDLLHELQWIASGAADAGTAEAGPSVRKASSRVAWTIAGVLGLALAAAAIVVVRHVREAPAPADVLQFMIPAPDNARFGGPPSGGTGTAAQVAISPDGRQIVFVANSTNTFTLWLRPVGTLVARQIPGTEDASFPFWSPDSRFVGFFAAGRLKKVQVSGGPPTILCDAFAGRGGTWNGDNIIVFGLVGGPLQRISGAGGVPQAVAILDKAYGEISHRWPHFLPDGRHFFFTAVTGAAGAAPKPSMVRIGLLDSSEVATLFQAESSVAYSSGHLLFGRDGSLMAQPYNVVARTSTGDAFPVAEQVGTEGSRYVAFSASATGVLVYARGAFTVSGRLSWFDRSGKAIGTLGDPATYLNLALSPDERRVAVTLAGGSPPNRDIWVIDVARGVISKLTSDPADEGFPIWSPDNSRVAFQSLRAGVYGLRSMPAAGTVSDELLLGNPSVSTIPNPTDWSADARYIAFSMASIGGRGQDLWILPLAGERKPFPFVQGPANDNNGVFAPNGRWIAYTSDDSGISQVFVQPFPAGGGRVQISKNGGYQPLWRGDGRELFFLAPPDGTIMAAPIDPTHELQAGIPEILFSTGAAIAARRQYAVSRDGKRFLVIAPERNPTAAPLTVVVNWLAAVQK